MNKAMELQYSTNLSVGSCCDLYMKNHLNNNNIVGGISKILSYPFNSKLNVNHNERCMHDICL